MARAKCYNTLDAYCRLIALLVRHSGDASNNVTKINLLSRVSCRQIPEHGRQFTDETETGPS